MSTPAKREQLPESVAADKARLVEANVNPQTGFASDYLNHFSEAVMLLELMMEMPECRDDFLAWHPKKYEEHFAASNFKHRDVAIAAYGEADPELRRQLDTLADSMNAILLATREVMRREYSERTTAEIADIAVRWVKPLVARAGAVINGTEAEPGAPLQKTIDALLAR
jgi:hypothetical protein